MSFEINKSGTLVWKNEKGQYHREKGAAMIRINGIIEYRVNNLYHRLNGPAEICPDGRKYYCIHGKYYSKEEYYDKVKEL